MKPEIHDAAVAQVMVWIGQSGHVFDRESAHQFRVKVDTSSAQRSIEKVVAIANDGDRSAHDALLDHAERLIDLGNAWPVSLQRYVLKAARKGPHRSKRLFVARDQFIALTVDMIATEYNISHTTDASSIVAQALNDLKFRNANGGRFEEEAIKKIWTERSADVEKLIAD